MKCMNRILVQSADFCLAHEYQLLRTDNPQDGAIVTFTGLVRDMAQDLPINGLYLEHYPAMTAKVLSNIVEQARTKWSIGGATLIHRIGHLAPAEQIVFVGVTSQHREAAYLANMFIMDYLKTQAPFWKKELSERGDKWVEPKVSDQIKSDHWE